MLAVRLNIAHGLPLTRAERTAAAVRIIRCHPQWSDRMIAITVGLSPRTVAKARHRSTAQSMQSSTRLGKDGRMRPINHAAGRLKVAALLADNPTLPIRAIAQQAGVSCSTVHNVRQRLRAGQHPTPDHHQDSNHRPHPRETDAYPHHDTAHHRPPATAGDIPVLLATLKKDSSPQAGDITLSLLRCLEKYRIEMPWANKIIGMVSPRWASAVAQLAREYARVWTHIAAQLEQRAAQAARATIPQQSTPSPQKQTNHHPKPDTSGRNAAIKGVVSGL